MLYKEPPSKLAFTARIQSGLVRARSLPDLLQKIEFEPMVVDVEVGGSADE